jgi:hypothetical protein
MNIEACPAPYLRAATIRADNPLCGNKFVLHQHTFLMQSGHHRTPKESHTRSFRVLDHDAMKISASHPKT